MAKNKEIVVKTGYDLARPDQMSGLAKVLKEHIVKHKLYVTITGKNYVMVEGWQFGGGMMGLFPRVAKVENLSSGNEVKWQATVEIVENKSGKVVSIGYAVCSNKEGKKKSFDEYAVLSMAQTRAIGKAYRNLLGWVMKLASFEATPSEEMTGAVTPVIPAAAPVGEMIECQGVKGGCPEANIITQQERDYSMRLFKKPLCRACQKELKKK